MALMHFFQLISLILIINGEIYFQKYKTLPGLALRQSLLWTDDAPQSLVRCMVDCREMARCYAISVSFQAGTCSYYDWFLNNSTAMIMAYASVQEAGDFVILVKAIPAMFMSTGYAFSYNDGSAFCESIGARLMSLTELTAVWSQGYDRCGCGWMDDGKAYFPTTTTTNECPHDVAINSCDGWGDVFDVYCTTN